MPSLQNCVMKKTKSGQTAQVQDLLATYLGLVFNDDSVQNLRCHVSSGKSCGCIQKFIVFGSHWKQNSSSIQSNITFDRDGNVVSSGEISLHKEQISRAKELLDIFHSASNLKKEKCYDAADGKDGGTIHQLRGMIGLGNGRKRSKKYEAYVLENREKLRDEYNLCEKAAQKILGYSINFLYKKLRTNPEKTSRLVATNKNDKSVKMQRQLVSVEELQKKVTTGQDLCCSRSCIRTLLSLHPQKIMDWRQRLEGCSQRVAQEIVAEVLRQADSLDGPSSFCQIVVHWVTGCSFKKIRRVRDHLKKDPQSLPEHGLKKYWKKKESIQASGANANIQTKVEVVEGDMPGLQVGTSKNHNNSSNKCNFGQREYSVPPSGKPPNQALPINEYINNFPVAHFCENPANNSVYLQATNFPSQNSYQAPPNITLLSQPKSTDFTNAPPLTVETSYPLVYQRPVQMYDTRPAVPDDNESGNGVYIPASYNHDTSQYCELQPIQPDVSIHAGTEPAPFVPTHQDQPSYYIASTTDQHELGSYHSGLTPLFLAQAPDPDAPQGNPPQSYFLFSPSTVNEGAKDGENWTQLMPLTPLQMLPASYVQNNEGFVVPNSDANVEATAVNSEAPDGNPTYLPSNLTPVAIMQSDANIFPRWISAQTHYVSNQFDKIPAVDSSTEANKTQFQDGRQSVAVELPTCEAPTSQVIFSQQLGTTTAMSSLQRSQNSEESSLTQTDVVPTSAADQPAPQGAAISDRNQRFSRDRLGATIESPCIVSLVNPPVVAKPPEVNDKVDKQVEEKQDGGAQGGVFEFPPTHVSRRLAALRMQGQPITSTGMQGQPITSTGMQGQPITSTGMQGQPITSSAGGKQHTSTSLASKQAHVNASPSKSLKGSLGSISEEFLQNQDSMIEDLSEITSLPILNLPSAGWSNDNITIKSSDPQVARTTAQENPPGSSDAEPTVVRDVKMQQAPVRKKRKADISSNVKTGPQKQIRFHIFTPSDFANGQVNVSQFRKPSVFASNIVDPDGGAAVKRSKKISKKNQETTEVDKLCENKAEQEAKLGQTPADSEVAQVSSKSDDIATSSLQIQATSASMPTPPLLTPALLKNLPSNIKVMLPPDSSTSVPLNTPVFLHSGALMTPSGKLNSAAFFCRVSPGQSLSSERSSTPQFFNFMPSAGYPLFLTPADSVETKPKSSKSSESSDDSPVIPLKRSHMTLNLSNKTPSSDDTLQTPSKILVVTPSAMLNSNKLTPDGPPLFSFQEMLEKSYLEEGSNKIIKEKEGETPCATTKSDLEKSHVPSIVVESPSDSGKSSEDPSIKRNAISADITSGDNESTENDKTQKESEDEEKLVIAVEDSPKVEQDTSPPLDTPTVQVVTPTAVLPASQPGPSHITGFKMRPQSLKVNSSGNSSSQISTPIFHLISPGQRSASSPSLMILPLSHKNSTANMLSPAFGYIQRPVLSGGGANALLKSALTKKLPVFQFPPTVRAPNVDSEKGDEGSTKSSKHTSPPSLLPTSTQCEEAIGTK